MHRTKWPRHHKYLIMFINFIIAKLHNIIYTFIQFNKIACVVIILVAKGWAVIINCKGIFCSIIMITASLLTIWLVYYNNNYYYCCIIIIIVLVMALFGQVRLLMR